CDRHVRPRQGNDRDPEEGARDTRRAPAVRCDQGGCGRDRVKGSDAVAGRRGTARRPERVSRAYAPARELIRTQTSWRRQVVSAVDGALLAQELVKGRELGQVSDSCVV